MLAGRLQRYATPLAARMENPVRVRHDLSPAPGSGAALCRRLRASSRRSHRPTRQIQRARTNSELDKTWGQGQCSTEGVGGAVLVFFMSDLQRVQPVSSRRIAADPVILSRGAARQPLEQSQRQLVVSLKQIFPQTAGRSRSSSPLYLRTAAKSSLPIGAACGSCRVVGGGRGAGVEPSPPVWQPAGTRRSRQCSMRPGPNGPVLNRNAEPQSCVMVAAVDRACAAGIPGCHRQAI